MVDRRKSGTWGKGGHAGTRYVRTPEGAEKYGLPMGAPITRDAIARAQTRGRNYAVPEDDKRFGAQAPSAGRTRRDSSEVVSAIRSSPAPRQVTPSGPKSIGVGQRGFNFPEGSRAFRSGDHPNMAIVRTPDYQLVVISDKGIAFELDGELERELNADLDDDASETWTPDEPNPNALIDVDGDGETGESGDGEAHEPYEDEPGYLNEDRIQEILAGLEEAGLDESTRDATEVQLRRNNDRIREQYEADNSADEGDGASDAPSMERTAEPTPERQPKPDKPAKTPAAKKTPKAAPDSDSGNTSSAAETPDHEKRVSELEELSRSRPTGAAEGDVNGRRVSVRRNRVDDSMEYSVGDERANDRADVLNRTSQPAEPEVRDTSELDPSEMTDAEIGDVLADIDDALRAGVIGRREARERREVLAAEQGRRNSAVEPEAPEEQAAPAPSKVGTVATQDWADTAEPGSVASSADGLLAERNADGSWETPIGNVAPDFFDESDVLDDDPIVVRDGVDEDGRPVGATRQIHQAEDLESVVTGDSIAVMFGDDKVMATRQPDGTFRFDLPDGLVISGVTDDQISDDLTEGADVWHVPNQDIDAPTQETWDVGDKPRSLSDLLAQPVGTRLRIRRRKSPDGRSLGAFEGTVVEDGQLQHTPTSRVPLSNYKAAASDGRVNIAEIPSGDVDEPDVQPVTDPRRYRNGDNISDYRHLRDMPAGQRVTLTVPASQNGGREAQVVLTRTRDESDLGGFMFLVGNGGRGYNSFGENNASLFQAIHDGRLHFGDLRNLSTEQKAAKLEGADWNRTRDIDLWDGGPKVSEYDLRTFIASQVAARAMQGSYYDTSLLPDDSPFRSAALRKAFSDKAIEKYSVAGNPARHKPAMIRLAAEKLGMEYTDPGSTLIPDDLTMDDFRRTVDIGRWLRGTGTSAENNMGPEQIKVTAADIKTALAVLDNMRVADDHEDPDKILKRVFARQGSPLQDLNVAAAIASYYRMRRFKINDDGSRTSMTTIARQNDKRRNRELLRNMLREQLEGREPGYYGLPDDEEYERAGTPSRPAARFVNTTSLSRPQLTSENDPGAIVRAATAPPRAPQDEDRTTPLTADEVMGITDNVFNATWPTGEQFDFVANGEVYEDTRLGTDFDRTPEAIGRMISQGVVYRRGLMPTADDVNNEPEEIPAWEQSLIDGSYPDAPQPGIDEPAVDDVTPEESVPAQGITDERRTELSNMRWREAYAASIESGDTVDYIRSVLGDEAVDRLNDGAITMRGQFERAWLREDENAPRDQSSAAPDSRVGTSVGPNELPTEPGSSVEYTRRTDGRVSVYTLDDNGEWRTNAGNVVDPTGWRNATYVVRSVGPSAVTSQSTGGDPRFVIGGSFDGADIREAPVGSHIQGASGREYRVTPTGVALLGQANDIYNHEAVARNNARFSYVADVAPSAPTSAIGESTPDARVGTSIPVGEIMDFPNGHFFRSSGGTIWQRRGSMLVSQNSGQRRRLSGFTGNFRYLGAAASGQAPGQARVSTPGRPMRTLEQEGLTRVPQDVIARYDSPRPKPQTTFDADNTTDIREYVATYAGRVDLANAVRGALPENSTVEVSPSSGRHGFTMTYRTPTGATGTMTRSFHGNGRVENAVAHASGSEFAAVQDHLFAFYRQHGITEVEVHGLSGGASWNGAHTWIRRGFRPDPAREGLNFGQFSSLRDNLSRIVSRTENGEFPQYQEFLDEAKDLQRRMTDLLNARLNMSIDERNEKLYQLWRELTYLGEVRGADGSTARGRRASIGWALLGRGSAGGQWYYGIQPLDRYFQN